jgi:hypothetical protein
MAATEPARRGLIRLTRNETDGSLALAIQLAHDAIHAPRTGRTGDEPTKPEPKPVMSGDSLLPIAHDHEVSLEY